MSGWSVVAILVAVLALAIGSGALGDTATVLANLSELAAVIAVFALVCAAEAMN